MFMKVSQRLNKKNMFYKAGFTLIEVLVVIAIILIISSVVVVRRDGFNSKIDLENTVMSIDSKIKLARSRSISAFNGESHGIHFDSDQIVIFQGDVYIEGDSTNEAFVFSEKNEINIINLTGGGDDLVFKRLTGETENFGNIGISVIGSPSYSRQILINSDGQSSLKLFQTSSSSLIQNARHVHFELGWAINTADTLSLRWVDDSENEMAINNITIVSYFNGSDNSFDWEGVTMVGLVEQKISIHGWEESGNTILCIMRENTEEEKLYIYADDGIFTYDIAVYEDTGSQVEVTVGDDGGVMTIK